MQQIPSVLSPSSHVSPLWSKRNVSESWSKIRHVFSSFTSFFGTSGKIWIPESWSRQNCGYFGGWFSAQCAILRYRLSKFENSNAKWTKIVLCCGPHMIFTCNLKLTNFDNKSQKFYRKQLSRPCATKYYVLIIKCF